MVSINQGLIGTAIETAGKRAIKKKKDEETLANQPQSFVGQSNVPPRLPVGDTTSKPPTPDKPQVIRDEETGKITFVTLPNGKTISGSDKELRNILAKKNATAQTPEGAVEATQTAAINERQQKAQELFNQFQGQPLPQDVLDSLSPTEIDYYQALASGATGASAGIVAGSIAGAIGGAGIGAVPGAVIGGIGGIIAGVRSNIASQIGGNITAEKLELTKGETNLRMIITDINSGGNPSQDVQLFYENVAAMRQGQAQLRVDTQSFFAKATGKDGTPELARYDIFFEQTLPLLENELQQAIANPNPSKVLVGSDEVETETSSSTNMFGF